MITAPTESELLRAELENARARIAELERAAATWRTERAEIVIMMRHRATAATSPGVHAFARLLLKTMGEE